MVFFFSFVKGNTTPHCKFNYESSRPLKHIPSPSDIVYDKDSHHFFIVSSEGKLYECSLSGEVIRKAPHDGLDPEGIEVTDSFVYVCDEKLHHVYKYLKSTLALVKEYDVTWGGLSTKSFRAIAYNASKKCFVLVSQSPAIVIEYDSKFKETERYHFKGARDISGARWYNGSMYLLSDLDAAIIKCDPATYEAQEYYNIDVLSPQGLAFDTEGNVSVVSGDVQKIFFFKNLPTIKTIKQ